MNIMQNKISGPSLKRWISDKGLILVRLRIVLCMVILIPAIGSTSLFAQGVGISEIAITPEASSILELRSTVRGFLAPRMTTGQRMTLGGTSPAAGLLVYDTDTKSFWYWDAGWQAFASGAWGTSNQLLGMNAAGNANEYKTLVGTNNQVYVIHSPGQITLSTPQDLHTGASPAFQGLTVSGLAPNAGVYTDGSRALTSTPPQSGVIGYWSRTGNVLSPVTSGDHVTTAGNIYTTGTGAITSAGLLTGNAGATISGGMISLNNNSNFPVNIGTGNSTGAVTLGNSSNTITLPAFNQDGVVHNNAAGLLSTGLIITDDIANDAITNAKMADDAIGNAEMLDNAIGTTELQDNAVTNAKMADNAIGNAEMLDNAIGTTELQDNAVTNAKMADNAIGNSEMLDNAIGNVELQNDAVTTGKILDGEIRTADIADLNVTAEKLTAGAGTAGRVGIADATGAVTYGLIPPASITGNNLTSTDLTVTGGTGATLTTVTLEIANDAITNAKMADNAIGNAEMLDNAIGTTELQDNAVTNAKMADNAIGNAEMLDNAIGNVELQNDAVTTGKILDGEIRTADIADLNVTAEKLTAGAGTAGRVGIADATGAVTYGLIPPASITGNNLTSTDLTVTGGTGATLTAVTLDIADNAITNVKMADNAIGNAEMLDNAIGTTELQDNAVTNAKMADNAIGNAEMLDNAIGTTELQDNAVTNAKMADNAIGNSEMLDNAIGNVELQNDAVTTGKILDGEVRTADIANLNVTAEKLTAGAGTSGRVGIADATGAVTYGLIPPTSITGNNLTSTDLTVTGGTGATLTTVTLEIANDVITNAKMADNAIGNAEMLDNAIGTTELQDNAVTNVKMADNAIGNAEMLDNAIGTTELQDNAVTNVKMADNAIGNAEMLDNAIGTAEIQDNSVTYNKLQNLSTTGRLLGSSSTTTPIQEITLGSGLSISGTTLTATGTGGTVTSVGLSLPSFIEVSNSPVTGSGILTGTLASQTGNRVFASPDGASGAPTFRSLLSNDIPSLDWAKITTGKPTTLAGYGITDAMSTSHAANGITSTNISEWNTAYGWGNHATAGYLTSFTESDPIVKAINGIVKSNGLTISSAVGGTDYVVPNAAITGGTNTKISYDSKGLVTGGTSAILASADYVNQGTISTILHGNASGNPSWGQIVNSDVDVSAGIDATKLSTGVVDNDEFNYLNGVTSGIQTQINSKANISGQVFTGAISATNLSGTNTGDVTLGTGSENYLSLTNQVLTASAVNLSGTNVTGILAAGRFPALTGDITNTAGSLATTIANNAVTYDKLQNVSTMGRLLGSSSTTTPVQEITLGSGLSISGTTLTATGTGGTVTSVGLSLPSFIEVSNSPVTGSGILTGTLASQTGNRVFASPDGASGAPTFRSLLSNDIPSLDWAKITTGKPTTLAGYGITDAMSTSHAANGITSTNISEWNTAYGWGNHATAGYLTSFTESDPIVKAINGIVKSNGLTISSAVGGTDYVVPNAAITGGTNTKISYDSKGLVTGGTSAILASADYVNQGTISTILHGNASGNPSWGQIVNSDVDVSAGIDATKLSSGVVDNDEFNFLNGVTSGIQTQIDSKADISGQVFTGGISATNLSGTNTGDVTLGTGSENYLSLTNQVLTASAVNLSGTNVTGILAAGRFPALTGDITNTAGSLATTIANNAVTYDKLQNVSTMGRLLGSSSTTTPVQEITLGSGLSISGTTLTATGTGGTVTSVGLSLPSFISVSNSPVTGSGVLTGTLASQTGNTVFAAPDGSDGAPIFRTLTSADIPNLPWSKITAGKPTTLAGYGITDAMNTSHAANGITSTNISEWNTAYGWGNHSTVGYLTSYTETDPVVKAINGIVKSSAGTISAALGGTDYVIPNAAITGGTNTKINYDSKGLVTGATSAVLASADYVNQGTISTVLHGNASGNPSWGQIVNADIHASADIADTKLATISTAGKVANSATTATSSNTAGTIVLRDGSGNFAAGTITANLTGNASSATNATNAVNATNAGTATNLAGGLGGSIPYQSSANTTAMLANGTAGQVLTSNGGTTAPSWSTFTTWAINGNSGTNPSNNFLGTTDNSDLVLRANSIERLRIESATGYLKIGNATSGTVKATAELVMRQDGDVYGPSILRLRNRIDENGAIFETTDPAITLIDFIFKTASNQRNIRYESRPAMARTGNPSFHIGGTDGTGADPDNPVLSIGDNYSAFSKPLRIGSYSTPSALLHLEAGTSNAGTAPIKFTSGTNLSTPENGAVEYDGNLYVTSSGTRYTLARTLTNTQTLDFPDHQSENKFRSDNYN